MSRGRWASLEPTGAIAGHRDFAFQMFFSRLDFEFPSWLFHVVLSAPRRTISASIPVFSTPCVSHLEEVLS